MEYQNLLTVFLQFLFSGLTVGAVYALVGVGFNISYNATSGDGQGRADPAGAGAQELLVGHSSSSAHSGQAGQRLECADQHGTGRSLRLADEIQAPMDAIGAVHIGISRWAEHHRVACRRSAKAVRGGVGMMIGLDLDNAAADAAHEQRRANQVRCDFVDAAAEEAPAYPPWHVRFSERRRPVVNRVLIGAWRRR